MGHNNKTAQKATLRERILYTQQGHIEVGSTEWFAWLDQNKAFYIARIFNKKCEVSCRVEVRSGTRHWYAYKRVQGTLYKRYLGQRPSFGDVVEMLEKMVGTDLYIPKQPVFRFDTFR